jgi:hypothetical protein
VKAWALLVRNVAAAVLVMAGSGAVSVEFGAPAGRFLFVWAAAAGGLAVAQRDDAYQRGMARR